ASHRGWPGPARRRAASTGSSSARRPNRPWTRSCLYATTVMATGNLARGVDLGDEEQLALALRIGTGWKELRRGAAMGVLRDHLFGAGADALEPGQVDTLELLVNKDAWRMSELADALRVDPSTATRAVQRLVKAGL